MCVPQVTSLSKLSLAGTDLPRFLQVADHKFLHLHLDLGRMGSEFQLWERRGSLYRHVGSASVSHIGSPLDEVDEWSHPRAGTRPSSGNRLPVSISRSCCPISSVDPPSLAYVSLFPWNSSLTGDSEPPLGDADGWSLSP